MFSTSLLIIGSGSFLAGACIALLALIADRKRQSNSPAIELADQISTFAIWGGYFLLMAALLVSIAEGFFHIVSPD